MHRTTSAFLVGAALAGASLATASTANAHISLEQGGTHMSRYGDGEIKAGPCGRAGGTRGTHVYTYAPGQTITVSLVEFVPHPSYFRFAFDDNGDDAFKEPASIKPIDPKRPCPVDKGDHCGPSDFYNSPAVLPGMDDLNPHLASGTPKWTFQVKLPDVECTNCTLQVIQVMEDNQFHGDYDPTPGVGVEDIYHQCIDLVLKRGTPLVDAGSPGGDTGDAGSGGGGMPGGGTDAGVGTGGGPGGGIPSGGGGGGMDAGPGGGSTDVDGGDGNGAADGASSGGCSAGGHARTRGSLALVSVLALGVLSVTRRRRRTVS